MRGRVGCGAEMCRGVRRRQGGGKEAARRRRRRRSYVVDAAQVRDGVLVGGLGEGPVTSPSPPAPLLGCAIRGAMELWQLRRACGQVPKPRGRPPPAAVPRASRGVAGDPSVDVDGHHSHHGPPREKPPEEPLVRRGLALGVERKLEDHHQGTGAFGGKHGFRTVIKPGWACSRERALMMSHRCAR